MNSNSMEPNQRRRRVAVAIVGVGPYEERRYQAQLRLHAGATHFFFGRREKTTSGAKKAAERIFGKLRWTNPPVQDDDVLQVSYVEFDMVAGHFIGAPDNAE